MDKVIFIAGLGHSGSTLIDLVMSNHSDIIGFGQIKTVYDELSNDNIKKNRRCSCGQTIIECPYWSKIISINKLSNLSYESYYNSIINIISQNFEKEVCLLDSSKSIESLKNIINIPNITIKVLHVTKDVRNWCISNIDLYKRKFNKKVSSFSTFLLWYKSNLNFNEYLSKNNIPYLNVGYDDFCLNTKNILINICQFLEIEYQEGLTQLSNSKSHVVSGNRMRYIPEKNKDIIYDNRWFHRKEWLIPSLLFPKIMKYNYENVYKKISNF